MPTSAASPNFKIIDIGSADFLEIESVTANGSVKQDDVNGSDAIDAILKSLNQPNGQKSIATYLLYDELGLQMFDEITRLDEYYLTNAERAILQQHADELANRVNDWTNIIELGSGSLTKTQVILKAMERHKKRVTYYALDLNQNELERSLSSLAGEFNYVKLVGLLGTYEQAIPWLKNHCTNNDAKKMILWLGSSIGSETRRESAIFLRRFVRSCLQPGDLFLIGFDRRKDPSKVLTAYNDKQGVMRKFILNILNHVNNILNVSFFNVNDFDYHSIYQENYGRHNFHLRAKRDVNLVYNDPKRPTDKDIPTIHVEQGELIHVALSHKYNVSEIANILDAAELEVVEMWSDPNYFFRLVLSEHLPAQPKLGDDDDIINRFFPYDHGTIRISDQDKHLGLICAMCNK